MTPWGVQGRGVDSRKPSPWFLTPDTIPVEGFNAKTPSRTPLLGSPALASVATGQRHQVNGLSSSLSKHASYKISEKSAQNLTRALPITLIVTPTSTLVRSGQDILPESK